MFAVTRNILYSVPVLDLTIISLLCVPKSPILTKITLMESVWAGNTGVLGQLGIVQPQDEETS